jgi:hypothetical protein
MYSLVFIGSWDQGEQTVSPQQNVQGHRTEITEGVFVFKFQQA